MSIKEKIFTAFFPKLIMPLRSKEKVIIKAPSIAKALEGFEFAYKSTMPLSFTSSTDVEKAKETLKALNAKYTYKKLQFDESIEAFKNLSK